MTKSKFLLGALSIWMAISTASSADTPNVQTPAPVIFLADNLDEVDGLGWCIDTVGRGFSDRLHAHSCKPRGGDVQFRFDEPTGQIRSVEFDGKCAVFQGIGNELSLLDCTDGTAAQKFVYMAQDLTFRPESTPDSCLSVGETSRSAGPFMSRDLTVAPCAEDARDFQTWVIKP